MRYFFKKHFSDKNKIYLFFIASFVLSIDGKIGGDEGGIYSLAKQAGRSLLLNFDLSTMSEIGRQFLSHQLIWGIIHYLTYIIFYPITRFSPVYVEHFLISAVQVCFFWLSIYIIFLYLKKFFINDYASLSIALLFFFTGYGISFVTGGFIECFMLFCFSLKIYFLMSSRELQKNGLVFLLLIF